MGDIKPWHDTPLHDCGDGKSGPIVPMLDHPKTAAQQDRIGWLRCASCGVDWLESGAAIVAHVWWSAGAYEGKEAAGE